MRPAGPRSADVSAPLTLRIDQLRLVGFSRRDGLRIQEAFSDTVTRLLQSDTGLRERLRARAEERLVLPPLNTHRTTSPRRIGEHLARALLEELAR